MPNELNYRKDFEEAYNLAHSGWGKYLEEAEIDLRMVANDQWDQKWKTYLASQGRSQTVFNRIRRVVNIVTGYQRKNRLALKIASSGNSEDDSVADQMSKVVAKVMMAGGRGYSTMSEAFEFGPLVTGANLVEPFVDFTGKIKFKRLPYNKFLLDPLFTERDLSDCRYVIRGEPISKKDAKLLMPERAEHIERLGTGTTGRKFNQSVFSQNMAARDMLRYEEFWQQSSRQEILLINRQTREEKSFPEQQRPMIDQFLQQDYYNSGGLERFAATTRTVRTVELQVYLQDELFYRGPDPYGLDEYRFVPLLGVFCPELIQDELKLQGLVRTIRDPQKEFNKRMSQQVDMIESQINSGYDAIEGTVANPDSLYKSGQGKTTWVKGKAENPDGLDAIRRKEPAQIPPSFFQLSDQIATLMDVIPGMNEELFGTEQKQIPGILSKMRTGAALTILQSLFDNYRDSKCLLGHKLIKLVQKNYDPQRVQKILGNDMPLDPAFYTEDIAQDDVVVTEGLLTDSQKEMYYQELKELRLNLGVQIPDSAIIDAAPMQIKQRLVEQIEAAEQAQAAQQAEQEQIQNLTNQLLLSQIAENQAQAGERETQIEQNATSSDLNRAKTLVELAKLTNTPVSLVNDVARGATFARRNPTQAEKQARKKVKAKVKK